MNAIDFGALAQQLASGDARLMTITGVALMALLLLWRLARRSEPAAEYKVGNDQFAATSPVSEEQVALLQYLQQAFPDGAVLYRPPLSRFLSVRRSRHRVSAQQRLASERVDFLVCSDEGKPLFAFEVDAFRDQDDPLVLGRLADKNRMLKSAGVRLIRLKGALPNWPAPHELRSRLLAAQRMTPAASPGTDSGFAPSSFGQTGFGPSRLGASSIMGFSALMAWSPANDGDPWASVRKRS